MPPLKINFYSSFAFQREQTGRLFHGWWQMVALSKLCNMQNHYTPFTFSSVPFNSWHQPSQLHFGKARPLVSLSSSNSQFIFYKAEYFILDVSLIVFLKFDCPSHISVSKGLYSYNGSLTSENNFNPTFGKWLIESH